MGELIYDVRKTIRFEAAHRLINGYIGKCAHNHGHSWVVHVTLRLKRGAELDKFHFVEDYGNFKPLKEWIDEYFDHATLINIDDKELHEFLNTNNQRHYTFNSNPTSEAIAAFLFEKAQAMFDNNRVFVYKLEVEETCTSLATVMETELGITRNYG